MKDFLQKFKKYIAGKKYIRPIYWFLYFLSPRLYMYFLIRIKMTLDLTDMLK